MASHSQGSRLSALPPLPTKWQDFVEKRCAETGRRLTPARLAVYAELVLSGGPISAYELIALQEERTGRKIAPLTVYRQLDFLIQVGLVHKLESINRFVPCGHPDQANECHHLLCSSCGNVEELESQDLERVLQDMAQKHGFRPTKAVVELAGLCGDCSADERQRIDSNSN